MTTFLCHVTTSFGHHVISFLQPTVQNSNGRFTTLVILIVIKLSSSSPTSEIPNKLRNPFVKSYVKPSVTHAIFCRGNPMQFLSQQNCIKFQTCSKPCDVAATNRTENRTWFTRAILKFSTLARQKLHRVATEKNRVKKSPVVLLNTCTWTLFRGPDWPYLRRSWIHICYVFSPFVLTVFCKS